MLYNFRGQPAKAEPLFERAVAIKQKALGGDNPEVVATVGKMCHFYLKSGNYAKGDVLSNKILAYADKKMKEHAQPSAATKEGDLDLATLLDGLGGTYAGAGKLAYGEQFYRRSLEIREKILSPSHIAIASSCENLAKLYMQEGRAAQAEPLYRRALEISRKVLGEGKPETLTRTDGLAQCCIKMEIATRPNRYIITLLKWLRKITARTVDTF